MPRTPFIRVDPRNPCLILQHDPVSAKLDRSIRIVIDSNMEFSQMTDRAMQVRQSFAEVARTKKTRVWSREEVMQGFVSDVGDLMKLVMAKNGVRHANDVDQKLAHELSDCLWSVLVLAKLYDVDLEKEFFATMNEIEAKLAQ